MRKEIEADGHSITLDMSPQVLSISASNLSQVLFERELNTQPYQGKMVSASVLAQKAKQTDDKLYATVERWAQDGFGDFPPKSEFLKDTAAAVAAAGGLGQAGTVVLAAAELGAVGAVIPATMRVAVQETIGAFMNNPEKSKPLGFYSDDSALTAIFRQDRMLTTALPKNAKRDELQKILQADPRYQSTLTLAARMTNPPARGRHSLLSQSNSSWGTILCPSRSHEAELLHKMFGSTSAPPAGFDLADELAAKIRQGTLPLEPTADSGWYDHQWFALEALANPDKVSETARLRLSASYNKRLLTLFRAILALTRETHVKMLEIPALRAAADPRDTKQIINIYPGLTVEPLPTYYQRRASSYDFVIGVIDQLFGEHWRQQPIYAEVSNTQAILRAAYVRSSRELGIEVDGDDNALAALTDDPDLEVDSRMMVPIFFDAQRNKTKVWAFLGWQTQSLTVGYDSPPEVVAIEPGLPDSSIVFTPDHHAVAVPVTTEFYVDKVLNRGEFRALCDKHKTQQAILQALGAPVTVENNRRTIPRPVYTGDVSGKSPNRGKPLNAEPLQARNDSPTSAAREGRGESQAPDKSLTWVVIAQMVALLIILTLFFVQYADTQSG